MKKFEDVYTSREVGEISENLENSYRISWKSLILCENHCKSLQTFEKFEKFNYFCFNSPGKSKKSSKFSFKI